MNSRALLQQHRYFMRRGFRKQGQLRAALMIGFLVPLALDIKKFDGAADSSFQVFLVGLCVLYGALYIVVSWLSPNLRTYRSLLGWPSSIWWLYIAVTPIPVLFWAVNIEHYLKVLLPFVLYGVGLSVMAAAERRCTDPAVFLDVLATCALLSAVWRAIYAVEIGGLSIESVRWQILGPGTPFLIGYGAAALYLGRRRTLGILTLSVGTVCVLLSITRSYLITVFLVAVGLLIVDSRRRSVSRAAWYGSKWLFALACIASASVAAADFMRPGFVEVWLERLLQHRTDTGLDITLVARLGEYRGQLGALTRNFLTLLIGNGIGADYTRDASVLKALPFDAEVTTSWFAGHSTWIYPFFASGVVVGWVVVIVALLPLVKGYGVACRADHEGGSVDAVLAFVVYLAYLGQSFTSNLYHERYGALILGVVSGAILTYAARSRAFLRTLRRAATQ